MLNLKQINHQWILALLLGIAVINLISAQNKLIEINSKLVNTFS